MPYKFIHSYEINPQQWDEALNKCKNALPFAYSWYLKASCNNWAAVVNDDYSVIMPLATNSKLGVKYIYAPWFAPRLGAFYKITPPLMAELLNAIPKAYKIVEICNNYLIDVSQAPYKHTIRDNFELNLNAPYDNLLANYHYKTRNVLNKANKSSLVKKAITAAEIVQLFSENIGEHLSHIKSKHYLTIKNCINASVENNCGQIIGAFNEENQLMAAVYSLIGCGRVVNLFVASNAKGKKVGAMTWLVDSIVKQYSQQNMVLDFAGSNIRSIARFNERFGSSCVQYSYLNTNRLPFLLRKLKA